MLYVQISALSLLLLLLNEYRLIKKYANAIQNKQKSNKSLVSFVSEQAEKINLLIINNNELIN